MIFLKGDSLRISIVTVCFNHARFIEACLLSVLDQAYPTLEYIVIDGGSTDGSREIIQKYSGNLHHWVSEPDAGQTDAIAKGFALATGEIMGWINSDDQLEPGSLQEISEFFQQHPDADVVTGDHIKMREDGTPIKLHRDLPFNRFLWFHTYNYTAQTSTFWRKSLYQKVGGMDPQFNVGMDTDLFARFADQARWYKTSAVWSRFRIHGNQKTQTLMSRMSEENSLIINRHYGKKSLLINCLFRFAARLLRISWRFFSGCYWARLPQNKRVAIYQPQKRMNF